MDEILGRTRCAQNAVMHFVQIIFVIEPNNSYGIVFRIAVPYLATAACEYQASDEIIEYEIQELFIVVQIRILSFVLRKEIFKTDTLACCVVMKWDFREDDFVFR
jgi:hypothetical protein